MTEAGEPLIHLALRFHVNLYHSYRGDSLDDKGIGKDIRIIRAILDGLDELNAEGIPVRGAWDIENHYSLSLYLPRYAPDIIARIRARVEAGLDEVEIMSWNNGLMTAHTREEFEDSIAWAISNREGSGLADLFGAWAPIVRPQECMFSASQIGSYRRLGVEFLSVYYSSAPFNGFASFVPRLSLAESYNPLTLLDPATGARMRLLPAYSPADVVENFGSLGLWLRRLRRGQLLGRERGDLLLLLDMDADDSFWEGILPSSASFLLPSLCGLRPLVRGVASLPWLRFSLPWEYAKGHGDVGLIEFGQDLADGSFDGYSSWAEKAENARLWPKIARARRLAGLAEGLAAEGDVARSPFEKEVLAGAREAARSAILLSLSTTHFGMASPVMNADRLRDAFSRAGEAEAAAEKVLSLAGADRPREASALYFDPRIDGLPLGSGALASLPLEEASAPVEGAFDLELGGEVTRLLALNPPSSRVTKLRGSESRASLLLEGHSMRVGDLELRALAGGGAMLSLQGQDLFEEPLSRPWLVYGGRRREGRPEAGSMESDPAACLPRELIPGRLAELRLGGRIVLEAGRELRWQHVYTMAAGLSSLRVDVLVDYPPTPRRRFDRDKASRLKRDWDGRWREVAPFELLPRLGATSSRPARVWKHGFDDSLTSYRLDYGDFGPDRDLDSFDNHVTDAWVAVAGEARGLLLAQADAFQTIFAFCPMRLRQRGGRQRLYLNPFGSYHGRQRRNPTAITGLGRLAALATGDNFDPYAPSWEGERLRFALMMAPYSGDAPPAELRRDALVFASSPLRA